MANKVKFGLRNVKVFPIETETETDISYSTAPISLAGAVELTLDIVGDTNDFYADDIVYYTTSTNQGYEGTLTLARIPEDFAVKILGETKSETDGVITENADAVTKKFALAFEFQGDEKATRYQVLYCTANRTSVSGSTKTETTEPQTEELSFKATPRPTDHVVKYRTSETTDETTYNSFLTEVYKPTI